MRNILLPLLLTLSTISGLAQIRLISVEPATNTIRIKNFGSSTVDISGYRLCSLIKYTSNLTTGITINEGSLNLAADAEVEIVAPGGASSSWQNLQSEADLGLYLASGSFGSTAAMVDFVQWGSAGHGRESVANSKGIWTTGEFVSGDEPYSYIGDGTENGASFWEGASSNSEPTDISLSDNTISENLSSGTTIGTLSSTDADAGDSHTYQLVAGTGDTDNTSFQISGSTLQSAEVFDFESKNEYSIRVETDDGNGGTFSKSFTINITNQNELPTDVSLSGTSVLENEPSGTLVGFFTTDDEDADSHVYDFVSGAGDTDNASFSISGNELLTAEVFDFETKSSYSIRIESDDQNGGTFSKSFTITVLNEGENLDPIDISLSNNSIDENNQTTEVIGTLSADDPNASDTHTFSLVAGSGDTDNGLFSISGAELMANSIFNFEVQETLSIRIQADDGNGGTLSKVFEITINNVNEEINGLSIDNMSIDENESANVLIGQLTAVDEDLDDSYTYSFTNGSGDDDNSSFTLDGDQLKSATTFNFEVKSDFSVRIQVTDDGSNSFEQVFAIAVNDVNDTPSDIQLSNTNVQSNMAINAEVGTFTITDEDDGDSHFTSLIDGPGSDHNNLFTISNNQLLVASDLNSVATATLSIYVQAIDNDGACVEKTFTLSKEQITSLLPHKESAIKLYPNPFHSEINISNFEHQVYMVQIIDSNGKSVYEKEFQNNGSKSFSITPNLEKGIYLLSILLDGNKMQSQVVIHD